MDKTLIITKIRKSKKTFDKSSKILELCTNKSVLDVGCVGQDFSYKNPLWLHKQIMNVCKNIDGVDIIQEGILELRKMGFSAYHVDELEKINKKYDVILMADVIEHVNDPVQFLAFYSSFLADDGIMIITTPNAHGVRNFTAILARNDYSLNPEHTFWFCPRTLAEVVVRAKLSFDDFYWLKESFTIKDIKELKYKLIFRINNLLIKFRSSYHPNFMLIVRK